MKRSCVFCRITTGTAHAFRLYEDQTAVAFLDHHPVREGHTLVVPRRHVRDVLAAEGAIAWAEIAHAVQVTSRLLVDRLGGAGITLFQSNGAAAGQVIFHLHVHLLPRYEGEPQLTTLDRDHHAQAQLADTHRKLVAGTTAQPVTRIAEARESRLLTCPGSSDLELLQMQPLLPCWSADLRIRAAPHEPGGCQRGRGAAGGA